MQGFYHGLVLMCVGIDRSGRYVVDLPAIGSRPAYRGYFPERYILRLSQAEARGDYEDF